MQRTVFFIPILLAFLLSALSGCKKDNLSVSSSTKDLWDKVSPESMNQLLGYMDGEVFLQQNDQIFFVEHSTSSVTHCWCGTENDEEWNRFTIDSATAAFKRTFVARQDAMDAIWILLDTRLIKITDCGSWESYVVADRDTLHGFDWDDTFVDMEIIDGTPWIVHGRWGVFRYDFWLNELQHQLVYPQMGEDTVTYGSASSIGSSPNDDVLFSNNDGKLWRQMPGYGFYSAEIFTCPDCTFNRMRIAPNGETIAYLTDSDGSSEWVSMFNLNPVATMSQYEPPYYFNHQELDRNARFAYYSRNPIPESYIGIQPVGSESLVVDVRDAVEEGSASVIHISFSESNQLYATTSRGIFKYIGREE